MYQLISNTNIVTDDFLDTILGNRGITEKERFLDPKPSDVIHYSKLINMKEAVELFKSVESKGEANVIVLVDSDIDGHSSGASLVSYIEILFPHIKIHLMFHKGKTHGLTDEIMSRIIKLNKDIEIDLIIIPDAGSSDYKSHHRLKVEYDIPVLVLDHHEADEGMSEFALVVNNQLSPDYPNKQLSGVGIVYKFLQALDDEYGNMEADTYLDLVALGNIADSMDLSSPETRYLVYEGLRNLKNKFLIEMVTKHIGDFKRVYPHTMSFSVIPKMNGIIRIGTDEEKLDLFNAFRGVEETFYNTRSKKDETLPQKVTRLCTNAHKNQKLIREKWLEVINSKIEKEKLNDNAFLLIEIDENLTIKQNRKEVQFDKDLGGLIAGNLASDYRKPVLMLIWDKDRKQYTGSLRGYDGFMKNTKDFLEGLELFDHLLGHQNACGFKIKQSKFSSLNEAINKKLESTELTTGEQVFDVDFYITEDQIEVELVKDVYSYEHLWGKGASKPLFATDILLDTSLIEKSASSNMVSWKINNVKFVQFVGDKDLLAKLGDDNIYHATVVGSLSINHFVGTETPQFLIEGIKIGDVAERVEKNDDKGDWLDDLLNW